MTFRTVILLALAGASNLWSQPAPAPARGGPPAAVRSPEVSADGRVTFRLRAPNAKEASVTGLGRPLPMQKDEQGVWSATTDPLKPDLYTYAFSLDGATFTDPGNPLFKTSYGSAGQSMVRVAGPEIWIPSSGPRGVIAHHFYKSALIGDDRDFYVYTPPNYDANRAEPYPVLYLLHGLGDEASAWLNVGAANVILDNLINQGQARPMIMVNTLGYGNPDGPRGAMNPSMISNFAKALVEEVMPQVEKAYRVSRDRNQRAIAGLSMGGAEAAYTGLTYLDRFAYIASFSGAFVMWPRANPDPQAAAGRGGRGPRSMEPADFEKAFPNLNSSANAQLRLFWIACGEDDGLNNVNRQFKSWLKSKDVRFTDVEIPGFAHVWPLWRRNLAEIAPMLFAAAPAQAQGARGPARAQRQPTPNDTLKSPEVLPDRRVTFRIYAPKASEVTLSGDWIAQGRGTGGSLERDSQGVWSITVGPLVSDFYSYGFTVDGVRTIDPKNPSIKQGITSLDNMFEVPGPEAAFEANEPVPHGQVHIDWYHSTTLDVMRSMRVYTPPGYASSSTRYPVFYLLHGGGDEDSGWSTIGRAGFILDNLLAAKKARPMIIVMPNGSMPRAANAPPGPAGSADAQARFADELLKNVIPCVEKNYRVLATRESRAIAGLSMGGGQTLRVAPANLDRFAYIGVWSSGVNQQATDDFVKRNAPFFDSAERTNKLVKLFWIGVGEKDPLANASAKNLAAILKAHGIKSEFHESEGGHTWINWRHYLNDYAQLLFR